MTGWLITSLAYKRQHGQLDDLIVVEALNSLIVSCADIGNGGEVSRAAAMAEAESDILPSAV